MNRSQYSTFPRLWEAPSGAASPGVLEMPGRGVVPSARPPLVSSASLREVVLISQGLGLTAYVPFDDAMLESFPEGERPLHLRGQIDEFSRQSRKRLKEQCAAVDWDSYRFCYFGSLTFADRALPRSLHEWRLHLESFADRFQRRFGRETPMILIRDFGKLGGRPHNHCIVASDVEITRAQMMSCWSYADRAAWDTPKSWEPFSKGPGRVRQITYCAKYCGKPSQGWFGRTPGGPLEGASGGPAERGGPEHLEGAGGAGASLTNAHNGDTSSSGRGSRSLRWWHKVNADAFRFAPVRSARVTAGTFFRVRRLVFRLLRARARAQAVAWGFPARKQIRKDIHFREQLRARCVREARLRMSSPDASVYTAFDKQTADLRKLHQRAGYAPRWLFGYQGARSTKRMRRLRRRIAGRERLRLHALAVWHVGGVGVPPLSLRMSDDETHRLKNELKSLGGGGPSRFGENLVGFFWFDASIPAFDDLLRMCGGGLADDDDITQGRIAS